MRVDVSKFASQKEIFKYLVENQVELIALKRAEIKSSDEFGVSFFEIDATKAMNTAYVDDLASGAIKRTIIANTYNWMDSHDDVHLDNVFAVTIKDRKDSIFHLADHEFKTTAKVGRFTDIYEKQIMWKDLGVGKFGYTMALFGDTEIPSKSPLYADYLAGEVKQHSVGMQYVKIDLAINDPEYKTEYATWNAHIDKLGNRDRAVGKGFFFAVKEAKLREISAVLEGSNTLTGTVQNIDPSADSQKSTPGKTSEDQERKKPFIYL